MVSEKDDIAEQKMQAEAVGEEYNAQMHFSYPSVLMLLNGEIKGHGIFSIHNDVILLGGDMPSKIEWMDNDNFVVTYNSAGNVENPTNYRLQILKLSRAK